MQAVKALFANDLTTLHAVKWYFWKLIAYNTFQLIKGQGLLEVIDAICSHSIYLRDEVLILVPILHFQIKFITVFIKKVILMWHSRDLIDLNHLSLLSRWIWNQLMNWWVRNQ